MADQQHQGLRDRSTVRVSAHEAFDRATCDLRMEGIEIDAEAVPELVAYRDGTMTLAEALESLRRRHAKL